MFNERIHMQTKIINISIPNSLLNEADNLAKAEYRNRSDLFREALRNYIFSKKNLLQIYDYSSKRAKKQKIFIKDMNQIISQHRKNK